MRTLCCGILLASAALASDGMDAYVEGLEALERGAFSKGVAALTRAVETEADNPDFHLALGVALVFHEKTALARKHLERAERLRPRDAQHARLWRAAALGMEGRFREDAMVFPPATRDAYETEVRAMSRRYGDPVFRRVHLKRDAPDEKKIQERERDRFPDLARKFVARVKPKGGRLGDALKRRGLELFRQKKYDEALRSLGPALRANPGDVDLRYHVALCKTETGALEGARRDLTICLTAKHDWGAAYAARARVLLAMGAADEAQADNVLAKHYGARPFEAKAAQLPALVSLDAVLDDPERATAWVAIAQAGRRRADETYQEELRQLRDGSDLAALGAFLFRESQITLTDRVEPGAEPRSYREKDGGKELAEAERVLDAALKQNANHPKALAYRAACRVRRGDGRSARRLIERAIQLAPSDPDVLSIVAYVLEYAARLNRAAARGLRKTDVWEDTRYVYYRYPSKAERRHAAALEREARHLLKRARAGLEIAVRNAEGTPRGPYFRGLLAQWDRNFPGALEAFRIATKEDPTYRRAWIKRMELSARLGHRDESYEAQFRAANLDHTTAAPLLRLAWIHIRSRAFDTARKLVDRAIAADPTDPRGFAYRGVLEQLQGRDAEAWPWFRAALAVHEAEAATRGVLFEDNRSVGAEDAARHMQYAFRAAQTQPIVKDTTRPDPAAALLKKAVGTYDLVEASERTRPVSRALLPSLPESTQRLPEAPHVETLAAWIVLRLGNRLAALGHHDVALRSYDWIARHEERQPINRPAGSLIRTPAVLARAYAAEAHLASGQKKRAAQALRGLGHPRHIDKRSVRELEEVRRRVEEALGDAAPRPRTLTEMRRQALVKERRTLVARKEQFEAVLEDPDASPEQRADAKLEIAELDAKIEELDQRIARVNRGR